MFTQILNSARDLATILIIIYVLVKSGPLTSAARDFFKRASAFMTTTENTMSVSDADPVLNDCNTIPWIA